MLGPNPLGLSTSAYGFKKSMAARAAFKLSVVPQWLPHNDAQELKRMEGLPFSGVASEQVACCMGSPSGLMSSGACHRSCWIWTWSSRQWNNIDRQWRPLLEIQVWGATEKKPCPFCPRKLEYDRALIRNHNREGKSNLITLNCQGVGARDANPSSR